MSKSYVFKVNDHLLVSAIAEDQQQARNAIQAASNPFVVEPMPDLEGLETLSIEEFHDSTHQYFDTEDHINELKEEANMLNRQLIEVQKDLARAYASLGRQEERLGYDHLITEGDPPYEK